MSLKNSLFGNWRTSLIGLVGCVGQAYLSGMGTKAILASLPTLLLGIVAKDSAVGSPAVKE